MNDKTVNFPKVLQILKRARRLKVYIGEYHVIGNQKLSKDPLKQLPLVNFDHISSPLAVGAMSSMTFPKST